MFNYIYVLIYVDTHVFMACKNEAPKLLLSN